MKSIIFIILLVIALLALSIVVYRGYETFRIRRAWRRGGKRPWRRRRRHGFHYPYTQYYPHLVVQSAPMPVYDAESCFCLNGDVTYDGCDKGNPVCNGDGNKCVCNKCKCDDGDVTFNGCVSGNPVCFGNDCTCNNCTCSKGSVIFNGCVGSKPVCSDDGKCICKN